PAASASGAGTGGVEVATDGSSSTTGGAVGPAPARLRSGNRTGNRSGNRRGHTATVAAASIPIRIQSTGTPHTPATRSPATVTTNAASAAHGRTRSREYSPSGAITKSAASTS